MACEVFFDCGSMNSAQSEGVKMPQEQSTRNVNLCITTVQNVLVSSLHSVSVILK